MKVRIGINPITWTNDDVPELGGDTPLEICLAETRQAGYAGTELGGKFPRKSAELKPIMQRYGLDARLRLVRRPHADEKEVDAEMDAITAASAAAEATWAATHVVYADTSRGRHGAIWGPISRAAGAEPPSEWPAYGRKLTALAERMADFGVAHGVPPPHGHHRRDRRGGRPADAPHRRGGRAALRHRPFRLFGRRSGGAAQARMSNASCTSTARMRATPMLEQAPAPRT